MRILRGDRGPDPPGKLQNIWFSNTGLDPLITIVTPHLGFQPPLLRCGPEQNFSFVLSHNFLFVYLPNVVSSRWEAVGVGHKRVVPVNRGLLL